MFTSATLWISLFGADRMRESVRRRSCAGGTILIAIARRDAQLGQGLLGLRVIGGTGRGGRNLVAALELALDHIARDRRLVGLAAREDRPEQDEDENEGEAGQADADSLHEALALQPLVFPAI